MLELQLLQERRGVRHRHHVLLRPRAAHRHVAAAGGALEVLGGRDDHAARLREGDGLRVPREDEVLHELVVGERERRVCRIHTREEPQREEEGEEAADSLLWVRTR